jgi:hypothetical protein
MGCSHSKGVFAHNVISRDQPANTTRPLAHDNYKTTASPLTPAACRQSRLLRFDTQGYQLFTVDHNNTGKLRLDLQQQWTSASPPVPVTPEHEMIPDANAGWLSSRLECGVTASMDEELGRVQWQAAGPNVMLAVQDDMLVEYDVEMRSPVGIVAFLEGEG